METATKRTTRQEIQELNSKICPSCGLKLHVSEFYKHNKSRDGRQVECKKCQNARRMRRLQPSRVLKLSDFDDKSLFAEIRKRGYSGDLKFERVISI